MGSWDGNINFEDHLQGGRKEKGAGNGDSEANHAQVSYAGGREAVEASVQQGQPQS